MNVRAEQQAFRRTTNAELRRMQFYADGIVEAIAALGLSVSIENDFDELVHFLVANGAFPYPAFDPRASDLDHRAFWVKVTDSSGKIVASRAQKVVDTHDFTELLLNAKLWFRDGRFVDPAQSRIIPPRHLLAGRVSHGGAVFVVPEHRKKGLSMWLPFMGHIACLRSSDPDWFCAFVFRAIAGSRVPTERYRYTHIEPCIIGTFPASGTAGEEMSLCYMDRGDTIRKIYELADDPSFPIPVPAEARVA